MALSARLQLRQSQSLVITPQLMQAIRLLQMSGLELENFVASELEQNPLLERVDAGEFAEPHASGTRTERPGEARETRAEGPDFGGFSAGRAVDSGWSAGGRAAASGGPDTDLGLEQTLPDSESLEEMLGRRIEIAFAHAPQARAIALTLLSEVDEAGYLTASTEAVAHRLGAATHAVDDVLRRCQEIAPTGVFARSLGECLALQLAERNRLDAPMQTLLANLDRVAARERLSLCALCGVDPATLDRMVAEIRALDPKPGLAFERDAVQTLIPDVIVRTGPAGGWTVELNEHALPRLIVNRTYFAEVSARCSGDADRRYLTDCLQKASWLEKSLDQRARTVLKVAAEIVERQDRFLADGVAYLRPLNLRMVADALGIHESTVSRAAANKTIATPRGIFEFRYFFTGAIPATAGGEAHSAEAVKHRIRKLILEESPDAILSDDAIVVILAREGVEIARRTVAKYRELMHIGSSVDRRRLKRLKAAS
jgi:RNA polymerase sigma-54 factor